MNLTELDRSMLAGEHGEGVALAMRVMSRSAEVMGAPRLLDVSSAHIDGCLYHGQASLDFVERLAAGGARARIPTTLNVGSIDLIHPELFQGAEALRSAGKRLMDAHVAIGCESTFTCAPYQLKHRPAFGEQIAWAESNAIVFANSVLGARTNRYGDFIDLCAAVTGRAPLAGLHIEANRHATVVFDLAQVPPREDDRDVWFALVGLVIGSRCGSHIPALVGLPSDATEDELKALGAASASSGAVALFHGIGVTPEAPTLAAALGNRAPAKQVLITPADMAQARGLLNQSQAGDALGAVCLGTPHFSLTEFARLERLLSAESGRARVPLYINTSRFIAWQLQEERRLAAIESRGITLVTDTCTYITPILRELKGVVMTNSGKMAHYAPSNIGVRVAFGNLSECVRSAFRGEVAFDV